MLIEMLFLAILFIPTIAAVAVWMFHHSSTNSNKDTAPINYWGAYHNNAPTIKYTGVPMPKHLHEEMESASHIHTIGVHP